MKAIEMFPGEIARKEKENGSLVYQGKKYVLLDQANIECNGEICLPHYEALAIYPDDEIEMEEVSSDRKLDFVPAYRIRWELNEYTTGLYERQRELQDALEEDPDCPGRYLENDAYWDLESIQDKLSDEGDACDWDDPESVTPFGGCGISQDFRIC